MLKCCSFFPIESILFFCVEIDKEMHATSQEIFLLTTVLIVTSPNEYRVPFSTRKEN